MPTRTIPAELQAHEDEILARVIEALHTKSGYPRYLASDDDTNIVRYAKEVLTAAEPLIAAMTLRAFVHGSRRSMEGNLPRDVQTGVEVVLASAEQTASVLERGWPGGQ